MRLLNQWMLDKSVANLKKGLASEPIDLSAFAEA
jgi:hypothetical protein